MISPSSVPWYGTHRQQAAQPTPPVAWETDRKRKAETITCAVCNACHWLNVERSTMCMFGGPYIGFDESRLTPD